MTSHEDREDAPITDPAGTDLDRVLRAADDELLRHIHAYGRPNAALLSIMSADEQDETSHRPPQPQPASTRTAAAHNAIALIESRRLALDLQDKAATARDHATECRTLFRRNPVNRRGGKEAAMRQRAESAMRRANPEGHLLSEHGERLYQSLRDVRASEASARTKLEDCLMRATALDEERTKGHRGGHRLPLLRLVIPLAILTEGMSAFVLMEVLVRGLLLVGVLAALAALIGAGMACVLANLRLNRLSVPVRGRILEGLFVAVLPALSLQVKGAGLAAGRRAALAALITALSLLGIEEVLVVTRGRRAAYWRWRVVLARARLDRRNKRAEAAAVTLRQHFLDVLLREGFDLDKAQKCAAALMRSLGEGEENRAASLTGAYRSARCRGMLADLTTELHESLRLARSIPCAPAAWEQRLELICNTADDLAQTSETIPSWSTAKLHDIGLSLAGLISEIDRFVADEVDVSGLDLSRAVLPDVDLLKGVIWTPETTWPPGLAETVRAQSTMIGEGVYQVIGGAERDPDLARV